ELVERSPRKPGETSAAGTSCHHRELVQFAPGHVPPTGYAEPTHDAATVQRRTEHPGFCVRQRRAEGGDVQLVAQVRLVRPVVEQRLTHGQARPWPGQIDVQDLLPEPADPALDDLEDVLFVVERHLYVELGELGCTVRPQVFVSEAAGDLVVALHAGDHQQLLHLLR